MTHLDSSGINGGSACREIRHLLGVYVVGAIDPSERSVVDAHLAECQSCRDELAGMAGLPAMLSRVPIADVERYSTSATGLPENVEPPAELLNSLLTKVAVRRRSRLWKGAVGIAAAAAVAAAGATAAVELAQPAAQAAHTAVASATSSTTGVAAVVDYTTTPWGSTTMRVQVSGISPGTTCQFWIVGKDGRAFAGQWTVQNSYGDQAWYPAAAAASPSSVHNFLLTAGGKVLLSIPR
jgi:Putative zinc-finger